jgi:hypothetical protein
MAACTDFILTVYIWIVAEDNPTPTPPIYLQTLTFPDLKVAANGDLTGDVYIGTTKLSSVTGTCRPLTSPDGNLLTLAFNWGAVDIFLTGFTYVKGFTKFKGRYIATQHGGIAVELNERLALLAAPGDGDTGTATGQQT